MIIVVLNTNIFPYLLLIYTFHCPLFLPAILYIHLESLSFIVKNFL